MNHIDVAFSNYQKLLKDFTPDYWSAIHSEADVRMKIIDKIVVQVLGWPDTEIHLEDQAGSGFTDYRLTVNGLNKLILEAKRDERELGINATHAGKFFKLNGSVFRTEAAREGIEQAISYCGHKNAELACVTNGHQWFIFRGNRLADGKDTLEGMACVFGSLEGIRSNFSLFYDLISFEGVAEIRFRPVFQKGEGQPIRGKVFKSPVRRPETKKLLPVDQLYKDLDRIMVSFFQELSGKDDEEARRLCFVTTKESDAAEAALARLSTELRNRIVDLDTSEASEITEAIKRVKDSRTNAMILLVGTKSAGKSTFIDRFFTDILPAPVASDCVVIKIDLAECGRDSSTIIKWLDEHFLKTAEQAAFPKGYPSYEDLMGMYWKEYDRWRIGPHKHLHETDKPRFKQMFGEHLERQRQDHPQDYIIHLLHRIAAGFKKLPCLIFDNADHFNVQFQEEVFKYANALYRNCVCLAILPITDTTSWQIAKQGPLQSFFTDSFFLPTPPIELVLQKRIAYIEKKTAEEPPEPGKGYFFGKGIPLEIGNIKAFTACLQTVFLNTDRTASWIGNLSNQNIRQSLNLTREIVASPHLKVHELFKVYYLRTTVAVHPDDIKQAIIRGKYDIYSHDLNLFIHNLFNLVSDSETTPLICLSVLQLLQMAWEANMDNDSRYVPVYEITDQLQAMNVDSRTTLHFLDAMLKTGLCFGFDPTVNAIDKTERIEITPSGRQHLYWATTEWVYLEAMSEVTPLLDEATSAKLQELLFSGLPYYRRMAIATFLEYLLNEDHHYCTIPNHVLYQLQNDLRTKLRSQIEVLKKPNISSGGGGRYARMYGRTGGWQSDRGFGFIRPQDGSIDVFVHITNFIPSRVDPVPNGTFVEYETKLNDRGKKEAIKIVIIANTV